MTDPIPKFTPKLEQRSRLSDEKWTELGKIRRIDYETAIRTAGRHIKKYLRAKTDGSNKR